MSNGMLGKTISLDENDGEVATTSSQPKEASTSIIQGNSENSNGPPSPSEILPDQVNRNESDNDEASISAESENEERPLIRRGRRWRRQSPIKIVGAPLSPISSPPRWLQEDEHPPPPKKTSPSKE